MTLVRAETWHPTAGNQIVRRGRTAIDLSPVTPPPAPGTGTKFGFWAGTVYPPTGSGAAANYNFVKTYLGDPMANGSYRMFHGASEGVPATFAGSEDDFGPPVVVSWKVPPPEVIAGTHDVAIRRYFNSIPTSRLVWFSYHHEPENNTEGKVPAEGTWTSAQYRAAWNHIIDLMPARDTLRPVVILMNFSNFSASRKTVIAQWIPEHPRLHGLFWDSYLTSNTKTIDGCVNVPKKVSDSFGLAFGIAEVSVADGLVQTGLTHEQTYAKFVPDLISQARAAGAEVCQWFETDKSPAESDWRMVSRPTLTAMWKQAVVGG